MENTTVVALIGACATVVVAGIAFAKDWGKKPADTSSPARQIVAATGDLSDSMVAIGEHITQTGTVHYHYAHTAEAAGPFDGKVASSLTVARLWESLDSIKGDYLRGQARRDFAGVPVSWPVVFLSLNSIDNDQWAATFVEGEIELFMQRTVMVYADFGKYPQLKKIEKGNKAWIEGRIKYISTFFIYLEGNAEITFEP